VELRGTLSFDQRNAWDIGISGGLDLESLGALNRDWTIAGAVQVNANVRGALRRPLLQGRMELKGASLSVVDVPNGLSNVNSVVIFSGTRATIQTLNAEVGGGKLTASGFMEFEGAEPTVRMQLKATQVRVRYPEGVSTQANANLILTGTTQQSLLSGDITVLRTGFTQRTDLSSILAKSSEPLLRPSARTGPLSGMQFDVRVETATDATIESNLAQAVQAEASLRLRGTAYNPVLLGRVTITQGEITFFGTKYTINQGSINFLNPVKLEPILNLDVETKVRGIDVILTFAGPLNKLTVTHRADPPLEFSEVVALLATGRTPTSDPTLAARQSAADSSSLGQLGASALVGQAIANPLSSRLQRFFGVSKLKIDPRLTGVENNPQARLTVEQQVTRTLTFTYITDLARSNQQIVRVEWWLNRQVSLVAIRDESGIFGLDVLYKKSYR
jgi:translocation and assembly module TamB